MDLERVKDAYAAWSGAEPVSDDDLQLLLEAHTQYAALFDIFGLSVRGSLHMQGDSFRQAAFHRSTRGPAYLAAPPKAA